jgi:cation transport regulator ChaB
MVTTAEGGATPVIMTSGQGGNECGFGGNWIWAFLIFALFGFGGMGGNRGGTPMIDTGNLATKDDMANQFNFAALERQNGEGISATNQAKYDTFSELKEVQDVLGSRINDVYFSLLNSANAQKECCCETLRAIDGVNYNNAMNTASINATTTAQTQKILDALCQSKIEGLQGQVNALQLQNALSGVVRYPNAWTYNAGTSPFCNGGCNC